MIRNINYNEMVCDSCGTTRKVWEGISLGGWKIQTEGYPFKVIDGKGNGGGYHEAHYCPICASNAPMGKTMCCVRDCGWDVDGEFYHHPKCPTWDETSSIPPRESND